MKNKNDKVSQNSEAETKGWKQPGIYSKQDNADAKYKLT